MPQIQGWPQSNHFVGLSPSFLTDRARQFCDERSGWWKGDGGKETVEGRGDRALGGKIEEKGLWEWKMMGRLCGERGERKEAKRKT